eukprot:gene14959-17155_t
MVVIVDHHFQRHLEQPRVVQGGLVVQRYAPRAVVDIVALVELAALLLAAQLRQREALARGLAAPARRVTAGGKPVELTASEYELLKMLMMRADRVVTRRMLEEQALPGAQANASNSLDVHMANLRRKIGEGYVRTVRGVGNKVGIYPGYVCAIVASIVLGRP